ncbi:MAG: PilZ domain-containing protein [bacterium]
MWFFGKKKTNQPSSQSPSKQDVKTEPQEQQKYVKINKEINIVSPALPNYRVPCKEINLQEIKLVLPKPLEVGTIMKLGIEFEMTSKPIEVNAQVIWTVEQEQNKKYAVGFKLLYSNPEEQHKVEKYLLYLLDTQSEWYKQIK